MPYCAEISRRCPTAFVFIIDQSGSMMDPWQDQSSKAEALSDVMNRTLAELIIKCSKEDGVRPYFDVGVIGYGSSGCYDSLNSVPGGLLKALPEVERNPKRVEDRLMRQPDGAGGLVEVPVKFPVWFDPSASGGTPMCAAFEFAAREVAGWCDAHMTSYPPIVLHITDGESTDGDPQRHADLLKQIATNDGNVIVFNLHIAAGNQPKVVFPSTEAELYSASAKMLFRMSSVLPDLMSGAAHGKGYSIAANARGYGYNADFIDLVHFFDIGTRPANLAR